MCSPRWVGSVGKAAPWYSLAGNHSQGPCGYLNESETYMRPLVRGIESCISGFNEWSVCVTQTGL